jgi:hypothetical protein
MAARSIYRSAAAKRLFAVAPRNARFYSASNSSGSSSNNGTDADTHFGFQTVKESLKASKGDWIIRSAIYGFLQANVQLPKFSLRSRLPTIP